MNDIALDILLAVVAVAVGAALALAGVYLESRTARSLHTRRVIVQLDNGDAVAGLMLRRRGRLLELADASVHSEGRTVNADGRLFDEQSRVLWVQAV